MFRFPLLAAALFVTANFAIAWGDGEEWDIDLSLPPGNGAIFLKVNNTDGIDHRVRTIIDDPAANAGYGLLYLDLNSGAIYPFHVLEGNGSAMTIGPSSQLAYATVFGAEVNAPRYYEPTHQERYSLFPGWLPNRMNTTDMVLVIYWLQLPEDGFLRVQIDWKDNTTVTRLRDGYLRYESTVTMNKGIGVGSNQAARIHVDDGYFAYPPLLDYQRLGILNVQIPGGPAYGTFTLDVGHHNVTEKFYQEQPLNDHAYDCVCPLWWQNVFTTQQDILVDFDFVGYGRNADINLILITHDNPEVPRDMWNIRKQDLYYDPGPA